MKQNNDPWRRLVTAARRAPALDVAAALPPGFATRVVALAFAERESGMQQLFSRLAWRAVGLAALVAVTTAVFNVTPVLNAVQTATDTSDLSDPVAEMLANVQ